MIRLVLFDVGNTIQEHTDIYAFCKRLDYNDPVAMQEFFRMRVTGQYDLTIYPDPILRAVKEFTGTDKALDEIFQAFLDCRGKLDIQFIKALKLCKDKALDTGLLTNVSGIYAPDNQIMADYLNMDFLFQSCDIGMKKPYREIYEYVEENTGYSKGEILFFDDLQENLVQPNKMGWKTVNISIRSKESIANVLCRIIEQDEKEL